jgi:nitrogen PTS system EIIA component
MKIPDFLSSTDVMIDVRTTNKHQLLQELARKASSTLELPADHVASELLKREQLGSTGVGGGVAIPHTRLPAVKQPLGVLARLKQPIDFDAIDGQAVDIVFLLLLPGAADADQLGALALVARKLKAPGTLGRLRSAKTAADFYSVITD